MIFVTLPVRDLPASRAFYEALGFRVNEHSSDETRRPWSSTTPSS